MVSFVGSSELTCALLFLFSSFLMILLTTFDMYDLLYYIYVTIFFSFSRGTPTLRPKCFEERRV